MAGAPKTRNWKALAITDIIGRTFYVAVSGEVQVTATNQVPKLSLHVPQGINPRILLLDLDIVKVGGVGGQIVFYRQVHYVRRTAFDQYDEVDILYRGSVIKRIKVVPAPSLRKVAAAKKGKKKAARRKKRR
jgi:hypothetical protein